MGYKDVLTQQEYFWNNSQEFIPKYADIIFGL